MLHRAAGPCCSYPLMQLGDGEGAKKRENKIGLQRGKEKEIIEKEKKRKTERGGCLEKELLVF